MKRVTGLGGVFFQCQDPAAQKAWYAKHLGIEASAEGIVFPWREMHAPEKTGMTVWSPFPANTKYFEPSPKPFMFNYRVENLAALLEELRKEGVQIIGEMAEYDFGNFGWILDPEGNKIELWEPKEEDAGDANNQPPK